MNRVKELITAAGMLTGAVAGAHAVVPRLTSVASSPRTS